MPFDAVIIGAGPSGLAAAARLAHFGVGVCLLEAHSRLGGLNSWHHVRGVEVSSGLHAFTNVSPEGKGGPLGKLLRQLRLRRDDLEIRPQGRSSIRFPSAVLSFSNDRDLLRQQVAAFFPSAIDGFDRLRRRILETDEGELTLRQTSARAVVEQDVKDPLLADMLFCPVMFYGNPGGLGDGRDESSRPDMDWLLFCVIWKCIFESGFGHPARGMRPLWELLANRIVANGGAVRLSSPVARLRTEGGAVAAAVLASGEEVTGRLFFSSAGAVETDALLSRGGQPSPNPARPVGRVSVAEGVCLLDAPAGNIGLTDTVVFYSFEDRFRFGRPDGLTEAANGVLCAPGNYLPLPSEGPGAPADNLLKITQLASFPAWNDLSPGDYAAAKQTVAAGMAAALGRLGVHPEKAREKPGRFALFDDLFTPRTLFRFTSHAEGAIYGSPIKTRTGATACPNLFLIGTDQGFHGIVGAMLSGVAMANLHCLSGGSL